VPTSDKGDDVRRVKQHLLVDGIAGGT